MDSQARSIAKTMSWRAVATAMTFLVSYFWLNDFASSLALTIVVNVAKTIAYYLHERGWNLLRWGRAHVVESRLRSVGKAVSWRALATVVTLALSYFWLDGVKDSAAFVAVIMTINFMVYYLHERGWNVVKWGKTDIPEQPSEAYERSARPITASERGPV